VLGSYRLLALVWVAGLPSGHAATALGQKTHNSVLKHEDTVMAMSPRHAVAEKVKPPLNVVIVAVGPRIWSVSPHVFEHERSE